MPRICTVCISPRRAEVDNALVAGEAVTAVAARLGLSPDAVDRHARNHLRRMVAQVREAITPPPPVVLAPSTVPLQGLLTVHGLASRLGALVGRAEALLQDAEADGSLAMRGGAIRELRATIVDALKVAAMLQPEVPTVGGRADDMVATIVDRLLEALADHPEARRKAAQALAELAAV
jgi:hypothetical protein